MDAFTGLCHLGFICSPTLQGIYYHYHYYYCYYEQYFGLKYARVMNTFSFLPLPPPPAFCWLATEKTLTYWAGRKDFPNTIFFPPPTQFNPCPKSGAGEEGLHLCAVFIAASFKQRNPETLQNGGFLLALAERSKESMCLFAELSCQ